MKRGLLFFLYLVLLWGCEDAGGDNPMERSLPKKYAVEDINAFSSILKNSHPSLHLYITEKRYNELLDSMKKSIPNRITVGALFSKYYYILNEIGCAHTYMNVPAAVYDSLLNRRFFFPIPVKFVSGKLLVNASNQVVPAGTEILSINHKPVETILQDMMKYEIVEGLHRPTQQVLAAESFALDYFYCYGKLSTFEMRVIDSSGQEQTITSIAPSTLSDWFENKAGNIYYYDRVRCDYDLSIDEASGYALMQVRTFSYDTGEEQDAFENFCRNSFELLHYKKNIRSLIIDVRENGGGDLYNSSLLFSYLAKENFKSYESATSKIGYIKNTEYLEEDFSTNTRHEVDKKLMEEFSYSNRTRSFILADSLIGKWEPSNFAFRGNVYVITNAKVASAASYFSVMVKNSGVGTIVGEETIGGNFSGNAFSNLRYTLPFSKLQLVFPYGHIVYTYKEKKNTGSGLKPDFDVPDTYESFKNNKDRQLMFIRDSLMTN